MTYLLYRPEYETGKRVAKEMTDCTPITKSGVVTKSGYVVRWGSTATVNREYGVDVKTINSASAIHEVYDKAGFRTKLAKEGLAPYTWMDFIQYFIDTESREEKVIVRPAKHHAGKEFYFCQTHGDAARAIQKINGPYYISDYIEKTAEFRVFVVSGRVAAIVKKKPVDPSNPFWGCVGEGAFEYVNWSDWDLDLCKTAVASFNLSSLDFGALDVVQWDEAETHYTLEINTAPEMTPYYAKTIAKCFDHIVQNGKDRIPLGDDGTWKSYIHPAVSALAK